MNLVASPRIRIQSIDVLRGLVMIIMALDHVREFFHIDALQHDPLDPQTTTPVLFFTRWITHFCAPVFVLLSGTSAYLAGLRRGTAALSLFLLKRGLWLVLVEVTVVTFAWTFNPCFNMLILQVIWAIGMGMVLLGLLVRISWQAVLVAGLVLVCGHNLLDGAEAANGHQVGFWWNLLHHARFVPYFFAPGHAVLVVYAFPPWAGLMLVGYALGRWFAPGIQPAQRQQRLALAGLVLVVVFVILRFGNLYGDPVPWTVQKDGMRTFLSFLNVNKYPPSLLYDCITIGPALLLLALLEQVNNRFTAFARVFGLVPFFYYILHLYLIHLLTLAAFYASGFGAEHITHPASPFWFRVPNWGYPLWIVYLIWIGVIALLYPLCRWYSRYKTTHHQWWLSYL